MVQNVAPKQVWDTLVSQPQARLVDVRTDVEWAQIGLPDLTEATKQPLLISWQVAPSMQVNGQFIEQMREAGLGEDDPIYFLCRSGVRSMAAAQLAEQAGFKNAYNITDGFEGPPDGHGIRGKLAGWQADGLPWTRD